MIKNRHVDRDFDVVIKLKEADAAKTMDDLKGPGNGALLLVGGSSAAKDATSEEQLKIIQQVDIMKNVFEEFNSKDNKIFAIKQSPIKKSHGKQFE